MIATKIRIADPILPDSETRQRLAEEIKSPLFIADLLLQRGIQDKESARHFFLAQTPEKTGDEIQMLGIETAVQALLEAHRLGERVMVHGDYDVDGVTATAVLFLGLRDLGFKCGWFLPNRFEEGYGITPKSLDRILAEGGQWVISVDTGIAACAEIAYANEQGLRVIVTDHHQAGPQLPAAVAILNPNQPGCPYANKGLSGVGVAHYLLSALAQKLPGCAPNQYLELVALGSLADNVPVNGANRPLIRAGLRRLAQSHLPGVQALVKHAGLDPQQLSTTDVLFKITPLLNAMGRMGSPEVSLRLLLSESAAEAEKHLENMVVQNQKRRTLDQKITEEAILQVEGDPALQSACCLVLYAANWHEGVIGIVASRLVERYAKPAFVLALDTQTGVAKGSGRTITGFHLHKALATMADLLVKWGGHYYACGLSIESQHLAEFRKRMETLSAEILGSQPEPGIISPTTWLPLTELTADSMLWLRRFEPFGPFNELPLFCVRDIPLYDAVRIVGEKHLKFSVKAGGQVFEAIAFNLAHLEPEMRGKESLARMVFHPEWNEFRGRRRIQLRVTGLEVERSSTPTLA